MCDSVEAASKSNLKREYKTAYIYAQDAIRYDPENLEAKNMYEFTNNIINNPGEIREMIKKKIMSIVYEKEEVVKKEVVKKTRRKPVRRNKADGSLVIDKETKESKPKKVTKKKDETV